jgi:hypothetical protein
MSCEPILPPGENENSEELMRQTDLGDWILKQFNALRLMSG